MQCDQTGVGICMSALQSLTLGLIRVISSITLSVQAIYTTLEQCSTATNMSKDTQSDESAVSDMEHNEGRPEKQQPGNYDT